MSEITPELIASIANRLFQQLPGEPSGMMHPPSSAGVPASMEAAEAFGYTKPPMPPSMAPPSMVSPLTDQSRPAAVTAHLAAIAPTLGTESMSSSTRPARDVAQQQAPSSSGGGIPGISNIKESLSLRPPVSRTDDDTTAARSTAFGAGNAVTKSSELLPGDTVSADGLRQFVQRIRAVHTSQSPGLCDEDPAMRGLRERFRDQALRNHVPRAFDINAVRSDFPILNQRVHGKPLVWLDNAATTQKPLSVINKLSQFYQNDNSNIHRAAHTLAARSTDAYEGARDKIQKFLGASSSKEIIFVRGTTEGINLVAQAFGSNFLQSGDEIVLSTLEHHANIVPWQMVAQQTGAVLRIIPVNDRGEILMAEYQRLLGPRTRMVALTQASNSLGTILPVAEMTQMAKRYGARVLIDGAQSVAHIPVNVQEMGCDFFVFSGHKIFGPTGIGAVYGSQEMLELLPPWQGGGNMIKDVTFEHTTYHDAPARFEAGTPNIADAVGLGAALDYVQQLGLPNISKHEHELLEYATDKLSAIKGLRLIGTAAEKVGVLSFVLPNHSTEQIGKMLDREGIAVRAGHHCAQPSLRRFGLESTVRPSISLYNNHEDIDRLAEAVGRIR